MITPAEAERIADRVIRERVIVELGYTKATCPQCNGVGHSESPSGFKRICTLCEGHGYMWAEPPKKSE